jgi:hypothetical protein
MATYKLIETQTLTTSVASITFSSIPQTFTDLKLVFSGRTSAGTLTLGNASFNGSALNFTSIYLEGTGTTAGSFTDQPRVITAASGASATASVFGSCELYIPNYTSSAYKSYSADMVSENNATESYQLMFAGLWSDTSAITEIAFTAQGSRTYNQYSSASLYGIENQ